MTCFIEAHAKFILYKYYLMEKTADVVFTTCMINFVLYQDTCEPFFF